MFPINLLQRNDEQIVPRSQWLTIGKKNPILLIQCTKIKRIPIFQISGDILKNTKFFQLLMHPANGPKGISDPIMQHHSPFELPPTGDTVLDFVNELGYPEPIEFVSSIRTNYVYQPWRAILSLLNQCLTGKTSGNDYVLGNLKFVPKGETVEVFGMAIPDPLITEAIQQSSYYPNYLKMVAANTKKTPRESASVQPATRCYSQKDDNTYTSQTIKASSSTTKKPSKRKLPQKVRKGKPTFKLVDEDDEDQQETIPHKEDLERAIKLSLDPALLPQGRAPVGGVTIREPGSEATPKRHEVVGKGKAVVTEEQRVVIPPTDSHYGSLSQLKMILRESLGDNVQGEISLVTVTSGVSIPVSDPEKAHEAQAGPDPEPMQEDQTGSDSRKLHVSLAGPNPEHMDDEFIATATQMFMNS
ncbi:hypothetical protein Tco_1283220 [Tanacetum coccineum]